MSLLLLQIVNINKREIHHIWYNNKFSEKVCRKQICSKQMHLCCEVAEEIWAQYRNIFTKDIIQWLAYYFHLRDKWLN